MSALISNPVEILSKSLEETKKAADDFLNSIKKTKSSEATVVGLSGDLGSGKTTFAKCVGEILGVKETIQSPTFVLQKTYSTYDSRFKKLHHLDFYRIEDPAELGIFRLDELLKEPKNLVLMEWPEKAGSRLPDDMILVNFEFVDENTRKISYAI